MKKNSGDLKDESDIKDGTKKESKSSSASEKGENSKS